MTRRPTKPRLLRCDDCNLRRLTQRAASLGVRVCEGCRARARAKGLVDPAQAPLPFENEAP